MEGQTCASQINRKAINQHVRTEETCLSLANFPTKSVQ